MKTKHFDDISHTELKLYLVDLSGFIFLKSKLYLAGIVLNPDESF